ncbi:Crp/Fnr family transcriptional regulator [Marivirga arenosa]|uniref:Crp/Fnr family transcriptional regulator n=1 Tax=Marivirga arenosa TaxID=3059076 RepID=A0AA49GIT6_9BACT|nr:MULTISPECIES: Crp/Fnr family transcriptional regulator [unclassified Marivirga]WKK80642.2 Crp/Fnr family transcriptional regulator [Marivirga sp. BKB1-2]WMN06744.1 Crp/Fnr family transcriptional regulator [Marivirga sp. ABR2-2]
MKNDVIPHLSIDNELFKITHNSFNSPLNSLIQYAEELKFNKGQILFNVGNIARGFYMIDSGEIKVSKFGVDGKEQIIKILSKGDFIGHEALLNDHRFHEYTEVLKDADILYVSGEDFKKVVDNDPALMNFLVQDLCNSLNKVEDKLVSSAYEPVRGRLAAMLLELNTIYAKDNNSEITLSRADLAKLIGTAKETSIRLLSEFKSENLVDLHDHYIIIKDMKALNRIAQMYK